MDWALTFQAMQGIGQMLSVPIAAWGVWLVYRYTQKRDKAEFLRQWWSEHQEINIALLTSPQALDEAERCVFSSAYGSKPEARTHVMIFLTLNMIQLN